jgi:DNA-binding transcriptional LysR family regulator
MDRFLEMQSFQAVVDAGSFVGAADVLGVSKAAVSRHVVELENRLGIRLLHRTTRRVSLTPGGQTFYERSKDLLAELEAAEQEATSRSDAVRGLLRINAPFTFGILHLAPLWGRFRAQHPQLTLDVTLADRLVDLVEEGYDMAVRIAALPSSSLVSRRLATTTMAVCASPGYLLRHSTPLHPADLVQHQVIAYSYLATKDEWHFNGPHGPVSVRTRPWMHTNNGDTCRAAALADQGIILQPRFLVGDDLAARRLVELMPEYRVPEVGIYAVYPSRKNVPAKVRVMIDFLAGQLAEAGGGW